MAGHHAGDLPGRPAGPVSTCSVPGSPPPAGTPALAPAPMSARRGQGGAAAGTPAKRRPWAAVDPRASQPRPPPHHPLPVRPDAGRRPRRPPTAAARRPPAPGRGGPSPSHPGSSAARTARRQRRGHQSLSGRTPGGPGRLDTGHLDAGRPLDRLDGHPTADRTGGQGNARPGRRPDILGPATPAGRPDLVWVTAPGALGTQDGSAVTAPAPRP